MLAIPTAAAMNLGPLGDPDLASFFGIAGLIGVAAAVAVLLGAKWTKEWPKAVRRSPWVTGLVGVGLLALAPGGALSGIADDAETAASVGGASGSGSTQYFSTVDWTVITREEHDNDAVVSTEVRLYDAASGYTAKQMLEESVNPLYTKTTDGTTAEVKFTSLPALREDGTPFTYVAVVDKSGYYNTVFTDIQVLVPKPDLSTAQSGVPPLKTLLLKPIGDAATADMDTTYSANSAQFTYTVIFDNSDTDGWILGVAAKLTAATMTNIGFDNVAAGEDCEAIDVSGTTYIVYTGDQGHGKGNLGPNDVAQCDILLTTTSTTSDFGVVIDDLFQYEDSTAFNSHANIRDMTAESEVNPADAA